MPVPLLATFVALVAPLSSPPTVAAPDDDRMRAEVCGEGDHAGPLGAETAAPETARQRFSERALRLRRAATVQSYGLIKQPSPKFEAWSPSAERLDRDEALHLVGEHDLADRHEVGAALETWGGVASVLGSFTLMGVGFAGGAAMALFVYDPALGQVGSAAALGLLGMSAGALAGLAMIPVLHFITRAVVVDDDEALVAIQRYNRRQAEKAGLGEAEIPFEYLGY